MSLESAAWGAWAIPELIEFFISNVDPSYISHSELQQGRAVATDRWSPHLVPALEQKMLQALQPNGGKRLFVARSLNDATVVGLAQLEMNGPFAILADIIVRRDCRHSGIGDTMLGWAEEAAKAAGATKLFLESGAANASAHGFFASRGFADVSRVMLKDLK